MQTHRHSLIESIANTGSGFIISVAIGAVVFPMFGYPFRLGSVSGITVIYTVASIIRCYLVRRVGNYLAIRKTMS